MKTSLVGYQVEQLEINFNLDRPQFSICPKCSSDIIKLADGCHICGWRENQKLLGDKLSIPCPVQQPKQLERQNLDERFILYISDSNAIATVYKLLVYPDFSGVGHIDQCSRKNIPSSKNCSSKQTPPSKIPPYKSRRRKGEGTGYIYRRTITRKRKQYQESYYRYRDESGKLRSKYIPQRLLHKVQDAESRSLPIGDILVLLGGFEISRGEPESEIISRGELVNPPSTKKRKHGYGGGYIECKPINRSGKQYKQYWFHWEEWRQGDRVTKKSRYISKRLVSKVERMNNEKAPVEKILKVLETKSKRRN